MARTPFEHLWDYNQPAETEQRFRAFLPAVAADPDLHLQLLTQIARTFSLRALFSEAHDLLDQVENRLGEPAGLAGVRYLLERGRAFNSAGDRAAARPLFLAAFETALTLDADFYAVDAAHMMGIVEPPAAQIGWTEKGITLAEQSADQEAGRWLGALYNNLAWSVHDSGDYHRACAIFEKALAWRQTHEPGTQAERIARWSVGRALRSLGRVTEALEIQRKLAQENSAAGTPSGYVQEELGELLLLQERLDEAAVHFAAAYRLLVQDPWLAAHEEARLARLQQLGRKAKSTSKPDDLTKT